jgi:hypothetical protein
MSFTFAWLNSQERTRLSKAHDSPMKRNRNQSKADILEGTKFQLLHFCGIGVHLCPVQARFRHQHALRRHMPHAKRAYGAPKCRQAHDRIRKDFFSNRLSRKSSTYIRRDGFVHTCINGCMFHSRAARLSHKASSTLSVSFVHTM